MNKITVLISRFWNRPEITVDVTDQSIGVAMPLSDFLDALTAETGNPAMILTEAGLRRRLGAASDAVCAKMKAETGRVM